jgi:hypothetical protein
MADHIRRPATPVQRDDARRRAAARGREAVARWRISSAVWGARLYAALFAVVAIFPLVYSGIAQWTSAAILFAIALIVLALSELLRRGSRTAALLLVAAVVAAKLRSWLYAHEPLRYGAVWTIIVLIALANGVWGTFELAAARRDAAGGSAHPADGL